jgi:hypothetical protein
MSSIQKLLAVAVASIAGKSQERSVASLFNPGGTHAGKGEFAGMNDFEVVAFLVVLKVGDASLASVDAEVQAIIERANAKINMWKAQGKTREELLREFGQMLDVVEGGTQ